MLTRRLFLEQLAAGGATATLRPSFASSQDRGLGAIAAQRNIIYGSAAASYELRDTDFSFALAREAAMLSPEYEMKRKALEPHRGAYDFSGADDLLAFAHRHGMAFRGHTLVWHKSNPPWLGDALQSSSADALLTGYIEAVASRYKGRVHSWDVVNEAIQPSDGRSDGLRNTMWLKRFGPGYIDTAFRAAHEADPAAMLVYNDWGCEWGTPENDRFRAVTLDFLSGALARGVPIHALGIQGHLSAFGTQVDQNKLAAFLTAVQRLGLKILVTEHDVDDSGGSADIAIRDRAVADASRRFLEVMLGNPATIAVLTWGLSDRFLDPPGWRDQLAGRYPRMLPLDRDFRRKPMWNAMATAFA
ncbi:MAG TPA: endo-1,4-beta-xylanase [Rhizomicrobium sp.]|nr:endo-1,4-beta-xylanase [Rhizomicrobium sp.]